MDNLIIRMKRLKPLPRKHAMKWKLFIASAALALFAVLVYTVRASDDLWAAAGEGSWGDEVAFGLRVHPSQSGSPGVGVSGPAKTVVAQVPAEPEPLKSKQKRKSQEKNHPIATYQMAGPYAPLVYDLLSETLFENTLVKLGILAPDENLQIPLLRALPAQLPASGRITSKFGTRKSPFSRKIVHHNGVDVAVPRGSPVKSTGDGVVVYSGWHGGYGKLVEIDHGYGIVSRYGHNHRLIAEVGDRVTRGQAIALAGSSGRSTGPHIHYEVLIHGQEVDPIRVMFPKAREMLAREEAEFERQRQAGMILADSDVSGDRDMGADGVGGAGEGTEDPLVAEMGESLGIGGAEDGGTGQIPTAAADGEPLTVRSATNTFDLGFGAAIPVALIPWLNLGVTVLFILLLAVSTASVAWSPGRYRCREAE